MPERSGEREVDILAECGWVGPLSQAFEASVRWSRLHGHRHRIRWSADRGHWRIACLTPPRSPKANAWADDLNTTVAIMPEGRRW